MAPPDDTDVTADLPDMKVATCSSDSGTPKLKNRDRPLSSMTADVGAVSEMDGPPRSAEEQGDASNKKEHDYMNPVGAQALAAGQQEDLTHARTPTHDDIMRVESQTEQPTRPGVIARMLSRASRTSNRDELPPPVLPVSNLGEGVVGWESQDDPSCPLNFSNARKWWMIVLLSIVTFMTPLSSSILAPAIESYSAEFHTTDAILAAMPVSIYLLGYALGPLVLAPLSEIYGRAVVLAFSNVFFCIWFIGVGLAPSLGSLIAFRLLMGIGGSAPLTLGGGVIADIFPVEKRGVAISIWTIGPTMGPSLGPVIGALIAGSIGWRWSAWIVMIPSVIATALLIVLLPETNHRVLIQRKVRALRRDLNRPELVSCYEMEETRALSRWGIIKRGLVRPLKFLFLCPMIAIISVYISFVYGTVYLMYNSVSPIFEDRYGWSTGAAGLPFLSLGLGYAIGLLSFSLLSDRGVVKLTKENDGVFEAEMRLPLMIYYAVIVPVTFFWYGWAAEKQTHWIVPVLGLAPLGIGVFGIWMPTQAYIIDAYPVYAASSLAAFALMRSIVAAFLPLAGTPLFRSLGLGWGNSLLGFICVAMIPVPILIQRYGTRIRKRYPVKL